MSTPTSLSPLPTPSIEKPAWLTNTSTVLIFTDPGIPALKPSINLCKTYRGSYFKLLGGGALCCAQVNESKDPKAYTPPHELPKEELIPWLCKAMKNAHEDPALPARVFVIHTHTVLNDVIDVLKFERTVCTPALVIYLSCHQSVSIENYRKVGRTHTASAVEDRLAFKKKLGPVLEMYEGRGVLSEIQVCSGTDNTYLEGEMGRVIERAVLVEKGERRWEFKDSV
ncbi:hypothetical protein BDW74DRAFT_179294 [Aspergillus multicolor]|uniref:uncharacterized protein n=1 Tax=Aspergillus multicolor TaxID=41759 RepID=UPI003CCD5DBA